MKFIETKDSLKQQINTLQEKVYQLNAEIIVMKGEVKQKDNDIKMWIERGDRLGAHERLAAERYAGLVTIIADLLKNPSSLQAYKEIVSALKKETK